MNYKIYTNNYIECFIELTEEEVDNVDIFDSFTKAKKEYIKALRVEKENWNIELKQAVNLRKKDIT